MRFFTKLEKLSEKYIEGFFKHKFADHIQPAEIAKLILREMRDLKNVSVSAVYVPNEYTVLLGDEDWKTVEPVSSSLAREMKDFVEQKIQSRSYETVGEIKVSFKHDENMQLGNIRVTGSFSGEIPEVPGTEDTQSGRAAESTIIADKTTIYKNTTGVTQDTLTRQPSGTVRPKAVLIKKTGTAQETEFSLGERAVIMGRRRSNDICLEDSNISRVHASIDYLEGSHFITDLGSTNGTFVNGARVSKKKLAKGDRIRIGTTILEFKPV